MSKRCRGEDCKFYGEYQSDVDAYVGYCSHPLFDEMKHSLKYGPCPGFEEQDWLIRLDGKIPSQTEVWKKAIEDAEKEILRLQQKIVDWKEWIKLNQSNIENDKKEDKTDV